eukprot:scaffold71061_cov27-Tisochrysis_lutea.AAC.3
MQDVEKKGSYPPDRPRARGTRADEDGARAATAKRLGEDALQHALGLASDAQRYEQLSPYCHFQLPARTRTLKILFNSSRSSRQT